MSKILILIFISFLTIYSQESHITKYEVDIPANKLTKIIMFNADSTNSFTLFDNIIEQKQKVIFIIQPLYFSERNKYHNEIVLPFPRITSGLYSIHYLNQDTSFVKKMLFLK